MLLGTLIDLMVMMKQPLPESLGHTLMFIMSSPKTQQMLLTV
jgi:hypothetical protein